MRQSFEQVWTLFHQHVMPNLQALFLPVQLQSIASPVSLKPRGPIDIRNMALVSFRESICFSEPVLVCWMGWGWGKHVWKSLQVGCAHALVSPAPPQSCLNSKRRFVCIAILSL